MLQFQGTLLFRAYRNVKQRGADIHWVTPGIATLCPRKQQLSLIKTDRSKNQPNKKNQLYWSAEQEVTEGGK